MLQYSTDTKAKISCYLNYCSNTTMLLATIIFKEHYYDIFKIINFVTSFHTSFMYSFF